MHPDTNSHQPCKKREVTSGFLTRGNRKEYESLSHQLVVRRSLVMEHDIQHNLAEGLQQHAGRQTHVASLNPHLSTCEKKDVVEQRSAARTRQRYLEEAWEIPT